MVGSSVGLPPRYFFPPSSQSSYNYSVNIKYEYDLKNEEDSNDSPPGQPPCSTPSEYTQNHASQPVDTNFTTSTFVPSYSGMEIRSPKTVKDCFFNGYSNGDCEVDEETTCLPKNGSPAANGHESMDGEEDDDGEELNTKDLAQRISAELKRYSIPQAIFAQKILCRSQGTLSDLLRNPKPWSKLKSGRETFRRMAKWLQEPEFKRMSDLRMAGAGQLPPAPWKQRSWRKTLAVPAAALSLRSYTALFLRGNSCAIRSIHAKAAWETK
ncbi:CUT domain protein [Oesophagostomum dentatum]|uniref:CUT domain protein n=1 Tax=Oesophagostomum dentatum TaxID=61180 RepID=A0A0B1TD23_OESDE|nr:CUT domain protein [Oesophagostomum dentatum]